MKVDNKGGKGNPYHSDESGQFTSADGGGVKSTEEIRKDGETSTEESKRADVPRFLKRKESVPSFLKQKGEQKESALSSALAKGLKRKENEDKRSKIDTLKNFRDVHDKNLKKLKSSYDLVHFSEENVKKINNKIDELKKTSRICVNARLSVVPLILKNGQKNQFETNTTRGYYGPERLTYSKKKFGTPTWYNYGGTECHSLEKYGNIQSPDLYVAVTSTACDQYGAMKLFYKRENVDYRTTLTLGDSLDNRYSMQPGLFTDESDIGMWGSERRLFSIDEDQIVSRVMAAESLHDVARIFGQGYAETQIHGDITPSDFESASINDINDFEKGFCDDAILAAQELGIPVYCGIAGQVYQVSITRTSSGEIERKKELANL
jgi:hypothetical protein